MKGSVLVLGLVLFASGAAYGAGGGPLPTPKGTPKLSPELQYNEGLALLEEHAWVKAEGKFRVAITLNPELPEAWNELGHTLKMQGKYDDAVNAYMEALRLRPNYPQALEYLGEAYVKMGKMDDARAVLARLEPLDAGHAEVLERVIVTGKDVTW